MHVENCTQKTSRMHTRTTHHPPTTPARNATARPSTQPQSERVCLIVYFQMELIPTGGDSERFIEKRSPMSWYG